MLPDITDLMGKQMSVSKLTLLLITLIGSIKAWWESRILQKRC